MARDPQKLRKAYEYKLGKDLADKLSDAHIASLSNYYNRASNEEQSKIDSELIKGMGDFLDSARDLAKEGFIRDPKLPIQKYKPEDLSEVKAKEDAFKKYTTEDKAKDDLVESVDKKLDEKLGETSDSIMSEIDKLIADYQKKVVDIQKSRETEEEKVPEGLDSLLKDIRSEVGSETPKKGGALAVIPKPDKVKEETLVDEDIDPRILKLLGIEDTTGLDYSDYKSLLKEKMAADRMGGNKGDSGDAELLTNEYKRVKGNTGKFKVKSQKIKSQSFVAKTKPSSSVKKVTPLLPLVTPQETEQPIQPERQGMDKTLALIASKLNSVDKNVQQTTSNLQNKDAAENKQKNQDRLTAENTAAQRKEERIERAAVLGGVVAGVKKTVKPLTDMMGGLFDFFKRLGFAMFIMELLKFLKDPAKYINGITKWINLQIAKLEMKIENFVVDQIIKPTNDMIKGINTKLKEFVDGINPFIEKFKKLPGMGNIPNLPTPQIPIIEESIIRDKVFLGRLPEVDDDFMKFDKAPPAPELPAPGTTQPGDGTKVQPQTRAQPQETLMGSQKPNKGASGLLDFISKGEGGYNSMNQGTQGNRIVGSTHNAGSKLGKDLTQMTIGEVMERQAYLMNPSNPQVSDYGIFAAGRYQIIPSTMKEILPKSGLKKSDMFNQENQDILGMTLISKKQPRVEEYLKGGGSIEGAMDALANEFASMPDPRSGNSKYGAGNRALHSVEEVREALQRARKGYDTTEPKPTSSEPPPIGQKRESPTLTEEQKTKMLQSSGIPALAPNQSFKSNITPPVQKASLTTIGGLTGGDAPGVALATAGGIQSQAYSFSATNGADLSVLSTKETLRVVGT
jgi:hypothetical protein